MGAPSKGSVVLVPFPFSDLSQAKYRPAVVLAASGKGDWVLCQVTSKSYGDEKAIRIGTHDFESGGLRLESFARPGKLFTAHESLFQVEAGRLRAAAFERCARRLRRAAAESPMTIRVGFGIISLLPTIMDIVARR